MKGPKFFIKYEDRKTGKIVSKEYNSNYHFTNKLLAIAHAKYLKEVKVFGADVPIDEHTISKLCNRFIH